MRGDAAKAIASAESESEYLVIEGTTLSGKPFRPSDWAQRLAALAGRYDRDGRFRLHPCVRMVIIDGTMAVVVDVSLAAADPPLYEFLREFGCGNQLRLRGLDT